MYGAGDLNAAEPEVTRWFQSLGGCETDVGIDDATALVATAHVDASGVIHVDPAYSNPLGDRAYACLTQRLEGQRVTVSTTGFSAIWPVTLGHRTGR